MSQMEYRYVNTLSGGERRRVALATLLAQAPKIWLMDEPTNHLDVHYQIALLDIIDEKIRSTAGALMMVLHDVNLLVRYCSHAILMVNKNRLIFGRVEEVVTEENLKSLYAHPINRIEGDQQTYYFPG